MAFPEFSRWNQRTMPFRALLEADLVTMKRSWAVRIWMGLMAVYSLLATPAALSEESAVESLTGLFALFPLVWSTFVIVISSGAVASEAGVVADSILSKAVTRYEYILAKVSSRLLTVLGLYLLVTVPPAYIIGRYAQDALAGAGIVWAVLLVGMTLVLLTSMSVALSALLNRTLAVAVLMWFLWYAAGGISAFLGVEYLSPLLLIGNLPAILEGDYVVTDHLRILAGFGVVSAVFVLVALWHFSKKDL